MLDLDLVNVAQNRKGFIQLPTAFIHFLGHKATTLLEHLRYVIGNKNFHTNEDENGILWYTQPKQWILYYTALTEKEYRNARKLLLELNLIQTKQDKGYDRTASWRVDEEIYKRFSGFAYALFCALAPVNSRTIHIWWDFKLAHPDIVQEFGHLCPKIADFDPPADYILDVATQKERGPAETGLLRREENVGNSSSKYLSNLTKRVKENLPAKPKKSPQDIKPDKFIEFWNTQPSVPKCKMGSKAYETCREFFRAFQRYQVGTEFFPLDTEEQQRLQLKIINRSAKTAPKCGPKQIPIRTDEEMYEMIEEAAKVYRVGYAPVDKKKWLPTGLSRFLYNDHSRTYGRTSMFIEKLWARPPQTLDDAVYDSLWENADEDTQLIYGLFQKWYNINHGREEDASFSLKDHKRLLGIARDWRDYFYNELIGQMLNSWDMNRFDDYVEYIKYVVPEDCLNEDMPLGTFKKGGYFWKQILGEDSCLDG